MRGSGKQKKASTSWLEDLASRCAASLTSASDSQQQQAPLLSIIVPTFNERDNIEPLLSLLDRHLRAITDDAAGAAAWPHRDGQQQQHWWWWWEVVFVDDASADGTAELVQALQRRAGVLAPRAAAPSPAQQQHPHCSCGSVWCSGVSVGSNVTLVRRSGKLGLGTAYAAGLRQVRVACRPSCILRALRACQEGGYSSSLPALRVRRCRREAIGQCSWTPTSRTTPSTWQTCSASRCVVRPLRHARSTARRAAAWRVARRNDGVRPVPQRRAQPQANAPMPLACSCGCAVRGCCLDLQASTRCDVVASTRYTAGGGVTGWNWKRKLTSRGANLLAATLLGAPFASGARTFTGRHIAR